MDVVCRQYHRESIVPASLLDVVVGAPFVLFSEHSASVETVTNHIYLSVVFCILSYGTHCLPLDLVQRLDAR